MKKRLRSRSIKISAIVFTIAALLFLFFKVINEEEYDHQKLEDIRAEQKPILMERIER